MENTNLSETLKLASKRFKGSLSIILNNEYSSNDTNNSINIIEEAYNKFKIDLEEEEEIKKALEIVLKVDPKELTDNYLEARCQNGNVVKTQTNIIFSDILRKRNKCYNIDNNYLRKYKIRE